MFLSIDRALLNETGKKELIKIAQKHNAQGASHQYDGGDLAIQAGCTCCVAIITKNEIYVANAGDTRCVIASKGKAKDLSIDHKPDLPAEKRRV